MENFQLFTTQRGSNLYNYSGFEPLLLLHNLVPFDKKVIYSFVYYFLIFAHGERLSNDRKLA